MPCVVCESDGPSDPDHIKTRGSGGDDEPGNVWPLCRSHHVERHKIGIETFKSKYPWAWQWLIVQKSISEVTYIGENNGE